MVFSSQVKEMRAPPMYELVELARKYDDSISLNVGDPDFDTPPFIKEAAIEAIKKRVHPLYWFDRIKDFKRENS